MSGQHRRDTCACGRDKLAASAACRECGRPGIPIPSDDVYRARLLGRLDRSGGPESCWPITSGAMVKGYGTFSYRDRQRLAHRVAYHLLVGEVPVGLHVLHRCDNPPCCNPAHLWLGTHADNMADMARKGRQVGTRGKRLPPRRRLQVAA